MTFSLSQLIEGRQADRVSLHEKYINPKLQRALQIIGFDKDWVRGEGAYLWDREAIATSICSPGTASSTSAAAIRG